METGLWVPGNNPSAGVMVTAMNRVFSWLFATAAVVLSLVRRAATA